jgi:hypothetical protein
MAPAAVNTGGWYFWHHSDRCNLCGVLGGTEQAGLGDLMRVPGRDSDLDRLQSL